MAEGEFKPTRHPFGWKTTDGVRSKVSSLSSSPSELLNDTAFVSACCESRINHEMIQSFRHKGLRRFYENGTLSGIQAGHAQRLRMILTALDTAMTIGDMDIPGFRLHRLKGQASKRWSVRVSGNWRVTFEFHEGHAHVIDYEDYH